MENEFQIYASKINDIKKGYKEPLHWIIDYIKDVYDNSFFSWIKSITQWLLDEKIKDFDEKLAEIKKLKREVKNLDISDLEKRFLLISLNQTWIKYILFKRAIYLESEKQWFILSNKDRERYLRDVNRLQDIIYWPEISSIESEKQSVGIALNKIFWENKQKLS